jgi:hypothetical protein
MSSYIDTSAGTTVGISATLPASENITGFDAITYTLIGELSEVPEFGEEYAEATFIPLATGVVRKAKGSQNSGSVSLSMAYVKDDAGRAILKAALADRDSYSFEVSVRGSTDRRWFTGKVLSMKENLGNADNITTVTANISIDSSIVESA